MTTNVETSAFITDWLETLRSTTLSEISPDPRSIGVYSADMINGFVYEGPLASEPVRALVPAIVELFTAAWQYGIREMVLLQDTHDPQTPEFEAYPPHAIAGTEESRTIPELNALPFADSLTVIEKNALTPEINTRFEPWLTSHPQITTAVVVGNCTDLCIYNLAMYLRMRANAHNLQGFRVIVVANCVSTFDIPVGEGISPGAAHPGEFFHNLFLYHMAQNGIEVVSSITGQ